MRKLAIDYGKKRIGLAVSDSDAKVALGLDTLVSSGMRQDVDAIGEIAALREVDTIVLGLPLNMDGTEGKRAALTRKFGDVLKKATGLSLEFFDERLTSVEAEEIAGFGNGRGNVGGNGTRNARKNGRKSARGNADKGEIDKIAAMLILQAYLDKNNRR